jgi:hypothetical protein
MFMHEEIIFKFWLKKVVK